MSEIKKKDNRGRKRLTPQQRMERLNKKMDEEKRKFDEWKALNNPSNDTTSVSDTLSTASIPREYVDYQSLIGRTEEMKLTEVEELRTHYENKITKIKDYYNSFIADLLERSAEAE
jgi:hypothetical protein